MASAAPSPIDTPTDAVALFTRLRPRLYRYAARLLGSAVDGEDLLQDCLIKALQAYPRDGVEQPEAWLFRIVRNGALDMLRRRAREGRYLAAAALEPAEAAGEAPPDAGAALRRFLGLSVRQRSAVILKDVLGYSLAEIASINETSVGAVKADLHRGRSRLKTLAAASTPAPSRLDAASHARLTAYIEHFNARDFEGLRDLLAEEVRVEVVGKARFVGPADSLTYFTNYARRPDVVLRPALIDGRPGAAAFEGRDPAPAHFVLIDVTDGRISGIRDFIYVPETVGDAVIEPMPSGD